MKRAIDVLISEMGVRIFSFILHHQVRAERAFEEAYWDHCNKMDLFYGAIFDKLESNEKSARKTQQRQR